MWPADVEVTHVFLWRSSDLTWPWSELTRLWPVRRLGQHRVFIRRSSDLYWPNVTLSEEGFWWFSYLEVIYSMLMWPIYLVIWYEGHKWACLTLYPWHWTWPDLVIRQLKSETCTPSPSVCMTSCDVWPRDVNCWSDLALCELVSRKWRSICVSSLCCYKEVVIDLVCMRDVTLSDLTWPDLACDVTPPI